MGRLECRHGTLEIVWILGTDLARKQKLEAAVDTMWTRRKLDAGEGGSGGNKPAIASSSS